MTVRRGAAGMYMIAAVAVVCLLAVRLKAGESGLAIDAVVAVLAALGAWNASRLSTRPRSTRAWRWQTLVPLVWTVAPVVWILDGPPILADLARVAAMVSAAAAWWLVSSAVDTWSRVRLVIDGGLAAGSFFVVAWEPVFRHEWVAKGGGLNGVLALSAPLAAVWAATFLVGLMVTEMHGSHRMMPALFVSALLVTAGSDVAAMTGATSVWAVGWALAFLAVRTYRGTSNRREVFSTKLIIASVPYLVIAPALAVFVTHGLADALTQSDLRAGLAMVALLLLRQHVTLEENRILVKRLAVTERLLRHQATHDHLTGLAGRVVLWERLEEAAGLGATEKFAVAVIFVDLDGFKRVNDEHGHAAGDHVLVETALRLTTLLAPMDSDALAVRVSGDEFAVLLVGEPAQRAAHIARSLVDAIQVPVQLNGASVKVGASIGVASTASGTLSPSALMRAADVAMYGVKHHGKGGVGVAKDEASAGSHG